MISATLATRRLDCFAEDYLSTVSASRFVTKTHIQKKWESANKFLFFRSQMKRGLFFEVLLKAVC